MFPLPIQYKRNGGFTLAEVLITLVVIGVIAAITVPTLIAKYQKEQTVVKLKKAYSALAQTTNLAISQNGPIKSWELGAANNSNDCLTFLNKYIVPYLQVSKLPEKYKNNNWNPKMQYMDNSILNVSSYSVRFYLNNGASITSNIHTSTSTIKRLLIQIDINGENKPNKFGKDIFEYSYYVNYTDPDMVGKFLPSDANMSREDLMSDSYAWSCPKKGTSCAAVIMKDSWTIADDYPW